MNKLLEKSANRLDSIQRQKDSMARPVISSKILKLKVQKLLQQFMKIKMNQI